MKKLNRTSLVALMIAASLILVACGDSDNGDSNKSDAAAPATQNSTEQPAQKQEPAADDESQVEDLITTHMTAVFAGDGKNACAHTTRTYQRYAVGPNKEQGLTTCAQVIDKFGPESAKQYDTDSLKVTSVSVSGDRATAKTTIRSESGSGTTKTSYSLVRKNGMWMLDSEKTIN
jgi:hypothetical protein